MEQIFIDSGYSINLVNQKTSKYSGQVLAKFLKPTSQAYFEIVFVEHVFEWGKICILPRIVTTDSRIRIFQFNILRNVLYLNKKLYKISSPECSFCKREEETTIHLFYICKKRKLYGRN